jgi:hemerythrin-like domain-containing protein
MPALSELGQVLHEEHFRILVGICSLENRISGEAADRPLDADDPEDQKLLESLLVSLDQVIVHHSFEEMVIFPLIRGREESDLAMLLTREHGVIEPKARLLRMLTDSLVRRTADAAEWSRFRAAAADLIAEVMLHLEKEELTVVQRLSVFLDPDTDHELAVRHIAEEHENNGRRRAIPERHSQIAPRPTALHAGAATRAAARRRSTTPPRIA